VAISVIVIVAALVVVLAVVIAVVAGLNVSRRRATSGATPTALPPPVVDDRPMTGLETALAKATDRSGRPMRDVIDGERARVDDLRVSDDTGPLLRHALDRVTPPPTTLEPPDPASGPAAGPEPDT
jgi:hypothetical protein